jgi:NADH-quinone oxidoreductase subunit F
VIPGGSSCPVLLPDEIDVKMDFDSLAKIGSMLGSAGIIVMDDSICMVAASARLAKFYAHESCGQCTPCREGVAWISSILHRIEKGLGKQGDVELLLDLCDNIQGNTICPLGDACAMPVRAFVQKFKAEFEEHIWAGTCTVGAFPNPWGGEL